MKGKISQTRLVLNSKLTPMDGEGWAAGSDGPQRARLFSAASGSEPSRGC